jgi:hypothetical protein
MSTKQIFNMSEFKMGMSYHFVRKGLLEFSAICQKVTSKFVIMNFMIAPDGSRFQGAFREGQPICLKNVFTDYQVTEFDQQILIPNPRPEKPTRRKSRNVRKS